MKNEKNLQKKNKMQIELSNKVKSGNSKNQNEDEDILKKYEQKKRRKNLDKNNFNREKGFSTVKNQIKEKFSLDKLGKIKWAKDHASANRPMNKIQEITNDVNFCNCCNLPCETPGIIERFSCCDNPDNFSLCGKAVPLYFNFIKFCIIILIVICVVITIPMTFINIYYDGKEIKVFCKNYSQLYNIPNNNGINLTKICEEYRKSNETNLIDLVESVFDWFSRMGSYNILDYKLILEYKKQNNIKHENVEIHNIRSDYSFIGFLCMCSLFIINVYYIILLNAEIKADKFFITQPSDYTVLITDLQKCVNSFLEKSEEREYFVNENTKQDFLNIGMSDYDYINTNYLKTQIGQFSQFLIDNLFYSKTSKRNLGIYNLNLCYKLHDYVALKEKQEICKYKIFQIKNNPYQIERNRKKHYKEENQRYFTSPFSYIGLDWLCCSNKGETLESISKEKEMYENNFKSLMAKAKLNNFCGCIFATFNTIKEKEEFYNNYPHFFIESLFSSIKNLRYYVCCCFIDKKKKQNYFSFGKIRVYLAPEPEDIIWENMEFTVVQRLYRIIIVYSLSILLIFLSFIIICKLDNWQNDIKTNEKNFLKKYAGSFSISIIISVINLILEFIMKIFTQIEKQKSMTNYYLSFSIKYTIFTFITSALLPFTSSVINSHKDKDNGNKSDYIDNIDNKTLITNLLFLFVANSLANPIIWTINIPLIIKKIRIYFIERKCIPDAMHFKTQKELNDLYEYPDMDIAGKYSYISKTLLMTMFYLPIFPLGVLISIFGLVFAYFVEKFNFTHGYKRPEMLNEKLGAFHYNFFICILVVYSFGNYIFTYQIDEKHKWPLINIIIFSILSILPYSKPISYYFHLTNDNDENLKPIKDIYFSFYNDYQRQNPFTKKDGMYFYINELKNRGYISKFLYDILIKNLERINVMEIYYKTSKNKNLSDIQRRITMAKKKQFSMEDLKASLRKKFNKKPQNDFNNISSNKNNLLNKEEQKKEENNISNKNIQGENQIKNNESNTKDINALNIDKTLNKTESSDSEQLKYNYSLSDFTNKEDFLINQYNNPLLLSIGQGIKNIIFMDDNKSNPRGSLTSNTNSDFDRLSAIREQENDSEENELYSPTNPTNDKQKEEEEEKGDDNLEIEIK